MELFVWMNAKLDKQDLFSLMALAWASWSYHNSVTHGESWLNKEVGVAGFLKLVQDYKGYAAAVMGRSPPSCGFTCRSSWSPPRDGCVRINKDATVFGVNGVGLGVVIRGEDGKIALVVVQRVRARWNSAICRAEAWLY